MVSSVPLSYLWEMFLKSRVILLLNLYDIVLVGVSPFRLWFKGPLV